jgi:hypothetical protein
MDCSKSSAQFYINTDAGLINNMIKSAKIRIGPGDMKNWICIDRKNAGVLPKGNID